MLWGQGSLHAGSIGWVSSVCDSRIRGTNIQHSPRTAQKARKPCRECEVLAAGPGRKGSRERAHPEGSEELEQAQALPGDGDSAQPQSQKTSH